MFNIVSTIIQDRPKAANSLFVISDANGNLVEYVLDVIVDTSKTMGHKPTNDSPIQLRITSKAQWPLQRLISGDEVRYPIQADNPLLGASVLPGTRKHKSSAITAANPNANDYYSSSLGSLASLGSTDSATVSLNSIGSDSPSNSNNNDWIPMIEVNTHMGPHRRLFMGPQFVFKTFNANLSTTMLNANSSSVIGDVDTPIIDLSGDIELNTLE